MLGLPTAIFSAQFIVSVMPQDVMSLHCCVALPLALLLNVSQTGSVLLDVQVAYFLVLLKGLK